MYNYAQCRWVHNARACISLRLRTSRYGRRRRHRNDGRPCVRRSDCGLRGGRASGDTGGECVGFQLRWVDSGLHVVVLMMVLVLVSA
jgi:hypothetical protein